LIGALFLLQLLFPYKGWIILLVGLGGGWLIAHLWARSLAGGLRLSREMRFGWAQVGDLLQERFTLENTGWAPGLWVSILDHSTMPGYQVSTVTGIGSQTSRSWTKKGVCERRGLFTLGPTSLQAGDPFGFYTVTLDYTQSHTMMIMPPVVPLPGIDVAHGQRTGEGRFLATSLDRAVSASSVREFHPGDSLRWIHWPTTARREEPFVRTFDSTASSDWWIFLDMQDSVQAGTGQLATEEHGVILAASLANRGLEMGISVGLATFGEQLVWLPPRLGDDHRWALLRALALVNPGRRSLGELLGRTRASIKHRSSAIIITPDIQGSWLDSTMLLMRRGIVPTVMLLDRVSFGGTGDARGTLAALSALGVAFHLIPPDLLNRPEARPGKRGHVRITPLGRAVAYNPSG
jgi:uncharacterized protein (DUF58 family)